MLAWLKRYRYWLVAPIILLTAVAAWRYVPTLWPLLSDPSTVEEMVLRLGWFGPLAFVLLNAVQIVVAPVPGYVVQVAAGFLYGPFWGGVWGSIGLLAGATIAFSLARIFGRPLAEKLVGAARLESWESATHSTSTIVWFFLLLGPTGDAPYFLAGLSSVGFLKIIVITLSLRVPAVFLAAAAGGRAIPWWQLALIYGILALVAGIFLIHQSRIRNLIDRSSTEVNPRPALDSMQSQPAQIDPLAADLNRKKS